MTIQHVPGYTLKGHALVDRGRPFDQDGSPNQSEHPALKTFGYAKCQCGWVSPIPHYTNRARRRIHLCHKVDTDMAAFVRWVAEHGEDEASLVIKARLNFS